METLVLGTVDYTKPPPEGYRCTKCGKHGGKLWREWGQHPTSLLCVVCACEKQKLDPNAVDERGKILDRRGDHTDQVGGYAPATPMEGDKDDFYGYSGSTREAVDWWKRLPTRIQ